MKTIRLKFLVVLILCIFIMKNSDGQTSKIDSLRHLLETSLADTNRVNSLIELGNEFRNSNPDLFLKSMQDALSLSLEINYVDGEFSCRRDIGLYWWSKGDYANALKIILPLVKITGIQKNNWYKTYTDLALAIVYRDMGVYPEALEYALHSHKQNQHTENSFIGLMTNAVVASIFYEMNNLDSALLYIQKSRKFGWKKGSKGWPIFTAGRIYAKTNQVDSAFVLYHLAIEELIQEHNMKDLAETYNSMASLFQKRGNLESALVYAQKGNEIAKKDSLSKELYNNYLIMSSIYEKRNVDSAFYYLKSALAEKEKLYGQEKVEQFVSYKFNEELREQENLNAERVYREGLKRNILIAAMVVFLLVIILLFRNVQNKKRGNKLLSEQKTNVENALNQLKSTQSQLIQAEKMASLGELTAGIAHEIQNPLNFVNNFSEVNTELIEELEQEVDNGNMDEVKAIAKDIRETDINKLADEYLRLAFHGLRAKDKSFNATMKTDFDESIGKIDVIPQDIGRVILNLITNAFYVVNEKNKMNISDYEPVVAISTKKLADFVEIKVSDNGNGIPKSALDKIFQPFFTTKPTGEGTGLGLSISYDIIKAHGGGLKVETKEGEGSEFRVQLPLS